MHFSCASEYVAKRCSNDLTCEICLETMENLRSLRDRRVEARRQTNRARVALLVLNGASTEDIRRERRRLGRRRRGDDDDDDDEDASRFRFRVGDARADAFGWGSRNPCVWALWILSRPLVAIAWVRRENAVVFTPLFFFFTRAFLWFFFFQAARRDVSRLRLKRRFASRPPTNPRTLSSKKRMIGQAFDLASRFVSKTSLMLFVLAFWAVLLYSWYRSF